MWRGALARAPSKRKRTPAVELSYLDRDAWIANIDLQVLHPLHELHEVHPLLHARYGLISELIVRHEVR